MSNQENKRKNIIKFNHFDDAFKMLLLIITITLSLGAFTSEAKIGSLCFYVLIMVALIFWIVGHFFGTNQNHIIKEIFCKVMAWGLTISAGLIEFFYFQLDAQIAILDKIMYSVAIGSSLTIPLVIWFFSSEMSNKDRNKILVSVTVIFNWISLIFQLIIVDLLKI